MEEFVEKHENHIQEENLWNSISSYESILERKPNDHKALHSLSIAYGQIGDHTKAKEHILRLTDLVLREQNGTIAVEILNDLKSYAEDDPTLKDTVVQINLLGQTVGDEISTSGSTKQKTQLEQNTESATFSLAGEMTFAWKLVESGELSQDEYAGVINDLTEMSAQADDLTISLLHVLETRQIGDIETFMGGLSHKCGTPIISLDNFEVTLETALALPIDFVVARGALVFDYVGSEPLVVILNPYDPDICNEVKELLGGKTCHFFITQPSQFDRRVERIREIIQDREDL